MEIRTLELEEYPAATYLGSQAFIGGRRRDSPPPATKPEDSETYGVFDERGLQAKVVIRDYTIQMGVDTTVRMGGVAGVASLPASRGKGYAGKCLRYSIERMRDDGFPVSVLFPFSFAYYRRLGWEWIGEDRKFTVPTAIMETVPDTEMVRAATPDDWPVIKSIYARMSQRYRGMVVRSDKMWQGRLEDSGTQHTYTYLYEGESGPEGYLTFQSIERETTELNEFMPLTPRAYRALLGLLKRHEMQVNKFRWNAPCDDVLWDLLQHWDVDTQAGPVAMGRIVDVGAAIAQMRPPAEAEGEITFRVDDSAAPWNTCVWRVKFGSGRAEAASTTASPDFDISIQALSQIYFGTPDASRLIRSGIIGVNRAGQEGALAALFAGSPTWMADSF